MFVLSFKRARTAGLALLVTILIGVSLVPTALVFQVSEQQEETSLAMDLLKEALSLQTVFWQASFFFERNKDHSSKDFDEVRELLVQCKSIIGELKRLLPKDSRETELGFLLEQVDEALNRFRVALVHYEREITIDPSADNTEQLENIAASAQEAAVQSLSGFSDIVRRHILDSQDRIESIISRGQKLALIGLVGGVIMGILVALFLSRAIGKPIRILVKGTEELKRGNLGFRFEGWANDDLGNLARAFNDMSQSVEKSVTNLENAKKAAEDSSRAKSQFLANMSHEIRTPMNGVLGMAELLSNTQLTDRQYRFLSVLLNSGESLLNIINDILDFSKIEAGKLELENINFNLQQMVDDIVETFSIPTHSKGLELACLVKRGVPSTVCGDPSRLRQILVNLVGNAVKFTEKGEVVVRVSIDEEREDTVLVRFEIKDTGSGVDTEAKNRIFEHFSQADGSMTRKYGGTGLGLAIAKRLAKLMDGEIGVESTPGKGSTFWFTVRLEKQDQETREPLIHRCDLQGLRVLVVDDNDTNREILNEQLTGWGMVYEGAADGPEALHMLGNAAAEGRLYQLVILDMMMPGMDGMQLAEAIRVDPAIANVPLIILTSMGLRGDAEMVRATGVKAYLTKPVRQSELYNCIATVMGKASPEASSQLVTRHSLVEAGMRFQGKVLVAEDTLLNQEVAREMLESAGCHVDIVDNGLKAFEAVSSAQYDVIFMDCQMPEMDGYEAAKAIRQREKTEYPEQHIPIVALTAHAMAGDRERCLDAGMDDYLTKPFKQKDLGKVLERLLNNTISEGQLPACDHTMSPLGTPANQSSVQLKNQFENDSKPSVSDPDPIDLKALDNIRALQREGAPDIVAKLVNLYLDESPKFLLELQDAISAGDPEAMQKTAHKFKSNSANVGAVGLANLCKTLEEMGRSNTTESAAEILTQIEIEHKTSRKALERHIGKE